MTEDLAHLVFDLCREGRATLKMALLCHSEHDPACGRILKIHAQIEPYELWQKQVNGCACFRPEFDSATKGITFDVLS